MNNFNKKENHGPETGLHALFRLRHGRLRVRDCQRRRGFCQLDDKQGTPAKSPPLPLQHPSTGAAFRIAACRLTWLREQQLRQVLSEALQGRRPAQVLHGQEGHETLEAHEGSALNGAHPGREAAGRGQLLWH